MILCVRVPGLFIPHEFRTDVSASDAVSTVNEWRLAPRRSAHARTGPSARDHATDTSAAAAREAGRSAQFGHGGADLVCC